MPNRNLHEIMGHIGRDPELRYTGSQKPVCTFSVATSNDFKRNGEWVKNPPEWHNIVIWGELGELVSREFKKGDAIMVRGRHRTRSYESKGQKKQISEIIATEIYRPVYVKKTAEPASYIPEEAPIQEFSDDSLPDADIPF